MGAGGGHGRTLTKKTWRGQGPRAAPATRLRPVRAAAAHHGVGGPHGRRNGRHPAGDLAKTTNTEGEYTLFGYDSSNRPTEITTPRAG
ncbi:hypothetical protein ABZV21_25450 [Streptomyces clavifer]